MVYSPLCAALRNPREERCRPGYGGRIVEGECMELYLHIPFCVQKCEYCSFVSFPGTEVQKEEYIRTVVREAEIRKKEFTETVSTVYIGGGTPSLLSPSQFSFLMKELGKQIPLDASAEFTVEANPGTITGDFLQAVSGARVNRISMGMQAFQERLLKRLGRIHSYDAVRESVQLAREYGIKNLNLDLIFGIPGQTKEEWAETLDAALRLEPEHISAYGLIPEEGTPLFRRLQNHEYELPEPETEREMYDIALTRLAENGYIQYEISNFARPGYECRHNIGYWTQEPYIGLGISAASMLIRNHDSQGITCIRQTNPETMDQYKAYIDNDDRTNVQTETICPKEARFETIMLSLRMNRGISQKRFREMHGMSIEECFGSKLEEMKRDGLMDFTDGAWVLTRRGMDIQNSILVEFMDIQ